MHGPVNVKFSTEFYVVFFRRKLCLIFRKIRYIHLVVRLLATVVREPLVEKRSSMSLTIAVVRNSLTSWKWNSIHLHKAACVYSIPLGRNRFSFSCIGWFLFLLHQQFCEVRNKDDSSYIWRIIWKRRVEASNQLRLIETKGYPCHKIWIITIVSKVKSCFVQIMDYIQL